MSKPTLQHRAVAYALGRLLELDGQFVSTAPGGSGRPRR